MSASQLSEGRQMVDPFRLDRLRSRRLVPLRSRSAVAVHLLLQLPNELSVFAVSGDNHTEFSGQFQCSEEFTVVDAKGPFVGQKHLERCRSIVDDPLQQLWSLL